MKFNNSAAQRKIIKFVKNSLKPITVKSGKCRYNYKCQMNAVHEALNKGHKKLAMCMVVDGNWTYIHFINYKKGKFTDNTLGRWSETNDYYFVKWIYGEDYFQINSIFTDYQEYLDLQLGWWLRLTSNETF